MSLVVYDYRMTPKEIASIGRIVDSNDVFFNHNTPIPDTTEAKHILHVIDNADYVNGEVVIGHRFESGSRFNRINLSTGTKTALNVIAHPDVCFALYECGNNVWREIMQLHKGTVYLPVSMYKWDSDVKCDILYGGYHFDSLAAFMGFDLYTKQLCAAISNGEYTDV